MVIDTISAELKEQSNIALVAASQLIKDNLFLSTQNDRLKEEAANAFNDAE